MNSVLSQDIVGAESRPRDYFFNRYCLFALLAALSYPILFAFVYKPDSAVVFCSSVHAGCTALVLYRIVVNSFLSRKPNVSLAVVFLLVNLLYLSASSIKYFEPELVRGFISNNGLRLSFSMLSLLVLWLSYEAVQRWQSPSYSQGLVIRNSGVLLMLILVMLASLSYSVLDAYQQGLGFFYRREGDISQLAIEHTYLSTSEKIKEWSQIFFMSFMPSFLSLYHRKKGAMVLTGYAVLLALGYALISGSRGGFAFFVALLFLSLIRLHGVGRKVFSSLALSAPLLICIFSVVTLSVSGRVNLSDLDQVRHQLAYRFDLSDFAATLVVERGWPVFDSGLISDAFVYSLPKALYPDKYDAHTGRYFLSIMEANLSATTDYADTFFSMGAQLYGIIGYVLFPFLMALLLNRLERGLCFVFHRMPAVLIGGTLFPLALLAETEFNSLFGAWRMLPVYILFGFLLQRTFVGRRSGSDLL